MIGFFKSIYQVGQFFLTRSCPICFCATRHIICKDCESRLIFLKKPVCLRCGMPVFTEKQTQCQNCNGQNLYFDWHSSVLSYEGVASELIQQYKYADKLYLASFFAQLILEKNEPRLSDADLILPVPLSKKRLTQRTYNQSLEVAKVLAKKLHKPLLKSLLTKVKDTQTQAKLGQEERSKNLQYAFKCNDAALVTEKSILLVDDVMTTGSTLNACARVLKEAGAQKVGCVTAALTLKKSN